jgi:hypothetical protein
MISFLVYLTPTLSTIKEQRMGCLLRFHGPSVCETSLKNLQIWASVWGACWQICLCLLVRKWPCKFTIIQSTCACVCAHPNVIVCVSRVEIMPTSFSCIHTSQVVVQGKHCPVPKLFRFYIWNCECFAYNMPSVQLLYSCRFNHLTTIL